MDDLMQVISIVKNSMINGSVTIGNIVDLFNLIQHPSLFRLLLMTRMPPITAAMRV